MKLIGMIGVLLLYLLIEILLESINLYLKRNSVNGLLDVWLDVPRPYVYSVGFGFVARYVVRHVPRYVIWHVARHIAR